MNTKLKLSLLKQLSLRTSHRGFTLIELLVVVIIIGVLAAIALPNLLGQVGKARESEAKTTIGATNRAQQAYFTEHSEFAPRFNALEIPEVTGIIYYYYDCRPFIVGDQVHVYCELRQGRLGGNVNREYIGGVYYNVNNRTFSSVVCRAGNALKSQQYQIDPDVHTPVIDVNGNLKCASQTTEVK